MKIDRIKAEKVFRDYVSAYNAQDDKVRLKIENSGFAGHGGRRAGFGLVYRAAA